MKSKAHVIIIMLITIMLLSCTNKDPMDILPTPLAGKASVIGRVLAKETNLPLEGIDVWLVKIIRQGDEAIFVLDTVNTPSMLTNSNGEFQLTVTPGEYVIVIGNPEIMYEVISEPSGKAKIWNFNVDEIENVGELIVSIP